MRSVATILLESARFQGFLQVLTGNMSDQFIRVRCGIFLLAGPKMQTTILQLRYFSHGVETITITGTVAR